MHKHHLSPLLIVLITITPITKAQSWWDWSKDNNIGPVLSAGLAAVGIIGLGSWLLSESDQDVINQAQQDLNHIKQRYSAEQTVLFGTMDYYPKQGIARAQDQNLEHAIHQRYGHEQFYLIHYYEKLSSNRNLLSCQMNKVQQRIRKVESKMAELSQYSEKFDIANRARIQLIEILRDLENTAHVLSAIEQHVGSWQEYTHQKKKYRKHLAKLEQERKERERERKIREQQYELDRMNSRVRQLEYEKHTARQQVVHCNCGRIDCVHVIVNV